MWDVEQAWERECGREKGQDDPDAGGKSVSKKSQPTRTCRNPFEKSKSRQTEYLDLSILTVRNGDLFDYLRYKLPKFNCSPLIVG